MATVASILLHIVVCCQHLVHMSDLDLHPGQSDLDTWMSPGSHDLGLDDMTTVAGKLFTLDLSQHPVFGNLKFPLKVNLFPIFIYYYYLWYY